MARPDKVKSLSASVCSLNERDTTATAAVSSDCTPILTPANAKQLTEKPTPRRTYKVTFDKLNTQEIFAR